MIETIIPSAILILLLTLFYMFGTMRIRALIKAVAIQGVILALITACYEYYYDTHQYIVPIGVFVIKGIAFPMFLSRAMIKSHLPQNIAPKVRPLGSILIAISGLLIILFVTSFIEFPSDLHVNSDLFYFAVFTVFSGLFFIIARSLAFSQIVGYITFENGIFLLGISLGLEENYMIELAMILDVFVFVFISGIIMFHINTSYNNIAPDEPFESKVYDT